MFFFFILIQIFLKFIPNESKGQPTIIDLDDGFSSDLRQVIIWTNDNLVYWGIYASR